MPNTKRKPVKRTIERHNVIVASVSGQLSVRYENGRIVSIIVQPHVGASLELVCDRRDPLSESRVLAHRQDGHPNVEMFNQYRQPIELAECIGQHIARAFGLDPRTLERGRQTDVRPV